MARNNDTLWLPENVSITDVASGTEVRWPGTDAAGDFQGRPDDSSRAPSYLDSGWLSRVNRTFGRLFNARGSGALSHNTTVAEVASSVSPHWMEGGRYRPAMEVIHRDTRYICLTAHTSTMENAPGQSGAPWESVDYRSFNKLYPVGSLYFNYDSSVNPGDGSLLGFGRWQGLPADYFPAQAGGRYQGGTVYTEGLPNIKGNVGQNHRWQSDYTVSGVFRRTEFNSSESTSVRNSMNNNSIDMDASRATPIYGRHGDVVQPKTVGVYIWRRMA